MAFNLNPDSAHVMMIAPVILADGSSFDVGAPHVDDLPPTWVIAQHLSRLARFVGATNRPVDVAEHSLHVGVILAAQGHDDRTVLGGLLHDGAEFVTNDIPAPIKRMISSTWEPIERAIQAVIAERYGVALDDLTSGPVQHADRLSCAFEALHAMPDQGIGLTWVLPTALEHPGREEVRRGARRLGFDLDEFEQVHRERSEQGRRCDDLTAKAWTNAVGGLLPIGGCRP